MAKKKDKPQIINNIQELNLEIDYDKLAKSIIKAKSIEAVTIEKTGKLRNRAMRFLNGMIYCFVVIFAGLGIYKIWAEDNQSLVGRIFLTFAMAVVGIYAFLCQQESLNDSDSVSREHFMINLSLVALLVAILSFFKGVG